GIRAEDVLAGGDAEAGSAGSLGRVDVDPGGGRDANESAGGRAEVELGVGGVLEHERVDLDDDSAGGIGERDHHRGRLTVRAGYALPGQRVAVGRVDLVARPAGLRSGRVQSGDPTLR